MNLWNLIFRNLVHYRKPYLSTLIGVAISTAVLTGALIVGDSVHYSLQHLTETRLGKIRFAIQANDRIFRQTLADSLQSRLQSKVIPVLQSDGIAVNPDKGSRINRVQVIGMDSRFQDLWGENFNQAGAGEAIISSNTAEKLGLEAGDELILRMQKKGKAQANAPFVASKTPSVSMRLKVSTIAGDESIGRFSLRSNQIAPFSIFLPIKEMSEKLGIPGFANLLLFPASDASPLSAEAIDSAINITWTTDDVGLNFRPVGKPGSIEMTSDRIFMDEDAAAALQNSAAGSQAFLSYLVNSISTGNHSTPYSFVSAADPAYLDQSPTGREAVLNSWLAEDLKVKTGDSVMFRYYVMGPMRSLREDSCRFIVKSILDVNSPVFDSRLMPDFPGMSDAGNCREWETGAPVDLKLVRDKDEEYWNRYKGSPKAIISLETGQELWKNAFGRYTSFRFETDSATLLSIKTGLMQRLSPASFGFLVEDTRMQGERAADNSTDFGSLFLSLSFFIILSGLLLTALLFGMHISKRIPETAILASIGFTFRRTLSIIISETLLISLLGSILGVILGIAYNQLLIWGLNTVWIDAVGTSILHIHLEFNTLLFGAMAGLLVSLITMLLVLFRSIRNQPSMTIKGSSSMKSSNLKLKIRATGILTTLSLIIASVLLIYSLTAPSRINPGNSMYAGAFFLFAAIIYIANYFYRNFASGHKAQFSMRSLILSNIIQRRKRTLTAVSLLALGTFTIIITAANRKSYEFAEAGRESGTGGFLLWAETTLPVSEDLNTLSGKQKYALEEGDSLVKGLSFIQLNSVEGDDASCLNLNQVAKPSLLGIPTELFDKRKCFSFDRLDPSIDPNTPWLALDHSTGDGILPGYADQTVITWGLMKSVGDTITYHDETGNALKVRLIGGLKNSIFQGRLLVSDVLLRNHFPSSSRSKLMLIDGPTEYCNKVAELLEIQFRDLGMTATLPVQRLAAFNAVENTYLSVFMLLGGLGVLIGVFGLGIILLRNTHERKQELAIYLAMGFEIRVVFRIILYEYLFILVSGILIGVIAALASILPSMNTTFTQLPLMPLLGIISLIAISGFFWIYFPARSVIKKNLIRSLREE